MCTYKLLTKVTRARLFLGFWKVGFNVGQFGQKVEAVVGENKVSCG